MEPSTPNASLALEPAKHFRLTWDLYRATILTPLPIQHLPNPDNLPAPHSSDLADADYRALADFRFQIRRFLHFSEEAARFEGLEPQQHQFLLTIRALTGIHGPTVGEVAGHLLIRHHSAVGLADRLVERGLVERVRGVGDRRQVWIRLSTQGEHAIMRLSATHRAVLRIPVPRWWNRSARCFGNAARSRTCKRHKENDVPKTQDRNP